jgi:type I restriction enzyme S subunit
LSTAPNWPKVRIGDLGAVVTGATPPADSSARFVGALPFITPTDLNADSRSPLVTRFISDRAAASLSRRILPPRSVCFTCIGATIGKACLTQAPSITNQQINSVVVDRSQHDPAFLYYRLISDRDQIKAMAGGAATPIISKSAFEDVLVVMPPLGIQQKIAAILSAYDDLIDNNNHRIQLLEEMARRIYREWLVEFRYPGHESVPLVASELGPTPQDWALRPLFDVAEVAFGFPFKSELFNSETGIPLVRIRDLPHGESATRTTEMASGSYWIHDRDMLIGMDGDFHMCRWSAGDAWLNQRVARLRPLTQQITAYGLFLALEKPIADWNRAIVGTTVAHLGKRHLELIKILIPSDPIAARIAKMLDPIFDLEIALRKTTRCLRVARDLLLRDLISGDVDVTDLEIAVPPAAA